MRALVDADIFCYEYGNMKELETGGLLPWEITRGLVDKRIQSILEATEATTASYYLTDSKSNFRNDVATILPYKGHRDSEKPPHWAAIRQHLIDNYDAEVCYGIEADDKCGIEQSYNWKESIDKYGKQSWECQDTLIDICDTVICSRDKDLSMIPGHHYSWECGKQKEKKWFVSELDGIKSFYKQLLTGDSTDNILGLFGVGAKASCVLRIDKYEHEVDMFTECHDRYEERFGEYGWQFLIENARLLWIRRYPKFDTAPEEEVFKLMEMQYNDMLAREKEDVNE